MTQENRSILKGENRSVLRKGIFREKAFIKVALLLEACGTLLEGHFYYSGTFIREKLLLEGRFN
jgi:hypothetical protein